MAEVPFSKIPLTDLKDMPNERWAKSVVGGLNDAMLHLSQKLDNIEIKQIDIAVPDPWIDASDGLLGSWAGKGGSLFYMKTYDGEVRIRGALIGGVAATNAFTLPSDCWPAASTTFPVDANGAYGNVNIGGNGAIIPIAGVTPWNISIGYMGLTNRPAPLSCFPINVETGFKTPPRAVVAISSRRSAQDQSLPSAPVGTPSWRFIQSPKGPVVQITNITGLEYGCRQKVTLAIIGG